MKDWRTSIVVCNVEILHDKNDPYTNFCSLYHRDDFLKAYYANVKWHFALLLQLMMTESLRSWKNPNYQLLRTSEGSHLLVHREKVSHSKTHETYFHILFFPLQWFCHGSQNVFYKDLLLTAPGRFWRYSVFTSGNRLWSRGLKAFLPTPAAKQRGSCTRDHLIQGVSSGCTASAGKRGFLWQLHSTSTLFSMTFPRQKCRAVATSNLLLKLALLSSVM